MNKLITKIVGVALGLSMATGVGVAVAKSNGIVAPVHAAAASGTNISFSSSPDKSTTNGTAVSPVRLDTDLDLQISVNLDGNNGKWYGGGTEWRTYQNNNPTIVLSIGNTYVLTAVTFTYSVSNNGVLTYGGNNYASGSKITLPGNANQATFGVGNTGSATNGQVRFTAAQVWYSSAASDKLGTPSPDFDRASNTITWANVSGATSYELKVDNGSYSVATSGYSVASVSVNDSHTVSVVAKATGKTDSDPGTVSFHRYATKGTQTDPYTVADARRAIDNNDGVSSVYVSGIVSTINEAYSAQHSNISFDIVDALNDSAFVRAYRCTGTDAENVAVGDTALVSGTLTYFQSQSLYEFNSGCVLQTLEHAQGVEHTVSFVNTDGSTSPESQQIVEGLPVTSMPDPGTYSGHVFTGWSSDGGTTYYQPGKSSGNISGDTTFTAYWQTKGTESTPYTVTEALTAITNNAGVVGVCVQGIITEDEISNLESGKLTYYISVDGTSSNKLEVYKGKGLNNANFEAQTDLVAGATVVVYGDLTDYNTTKEFATGNYLKSYSAPAAVTYTVTFESNGGSSVAAITDIPSGTAISKPTDPTKSGYVFAGWYTDSGLTSEYNFSSLVTSSFTLYAKWTEDTPSSEGTIVWSRSESEDTFTTGYEQYKVHGSLDSGGFYKDDSTGIQLGIKKSSGAIWTTTVPATRKLTVKVGGGSAKDPLGNSVKAYFLDSSYSIINASETVVTTKVVTKTGDDYEIYMPSTENVYGVAVKHTKETSYNVRIYGMTLEYNDSTPITQYTVTYDGNGGEGTMTDSNSPYNANASVTTLTNTFTRTGYTFAHWNTASDGTGTSYDEGVSFNISGNVTLYAIWDEESSGSVTAARCYHQVTDTSDLVAGAKYIITSASDHANGFHAMSTNQKSSNRGATSISANGTVAAVSVDDAQVITLGGSTGAWTLGVTDGYLYASSSSSNQLKTQENNDTNGQWAITFSDGVASIVAQGSNTRNVMQYNYNNGSPLFACYASASQSAVYMYRLDFSETLLHNITCDGNGSYTIASGYSWNDLKGVYQDLPSAEQTSLKTASTAGLARYDYLIAKYGTSTFENFIGRTITPLQSSRTILLGLAGNSATVSTVVIILSMLTLTAVGGYFFMRKKKEQ